MGKNITLADENYFLTLGDEYTFMPVPVAARSKGRSVAAHLLGLWVKKCICMYVYVYVCVCVYIYIYIYIYTHTHTHTHTHFCQNVINHILYVEVFEGLCTYYR